MTFFFGVVVGWCLWIAVDGVLLIARSYRRLKQLDAQADGARRGSNRGEDLVE